jgi:hypothetical protein
MMLGTQTKLESVYLLISFFLLCLLCCCATEFGNSGGTYELLCILWHVNPLLSNDSEISSFTTSLARWWSCLHRRC